MTGKELYVKCIEVFVLIVLVVTVTVLVRSNLNVINITISMRYLSSPIISVGLVITTLRELRELRTTDEYYCSVNIPHQEDED